MIPASFAVPTIRKKFAIGICRESIMRPPYWSQIQDILIATILSASRFSNFATELPVSVL